MREAGWEASNPAVVVGPDGAHHHLTATPPQQVAKHFISDVRKRCLQPVVDRALGGSMSPRAQEIRGRGLSAIGPRRLLTSKKFPKHYRRRLEQ
eukprot:2373671-Pyramimonas_sp.AAC.1